MPREDAPVVGYSVFCRYLFLCCASLRVKNCCDFQKVSALPYPKKDKEYFMIRMLLIICSGLVAINYMIKLEKIKGKPVNWFTLSRKELVIDMQKPKNLILWFLSLWKLMRLYQKQEI